MSESIPKRVGTGIEALIPSAARLRISADDLVAAEDPYRLGESPEEATGRAARAYESRVRMWRTRVPTRFAAASLADLSPDQDPGGKVSRWLDSLSTTLVLHSERPGLGKTHAAYAVGNRAVEDGQWAMAWNMVDLNDAFRPGNDSTAYSVAQECGLLVLDDVGRERMTEWTLERLQGVLDARWRNALLTVVTTNLAGSAFSERYGDPIVDRLTDGLTYVTVNGTSRRKPAPW